MRRKIVIEEYDTEVVIREYENDVQVWYGRFPIYDSASILNAVRTVVIGDNR